METLTAGRHTAGMTTTHTEKMLAEALRICRRVTGRTDVDDALLRAVFMRLDDEGQDLLDDMDEILQAGASVH